MSIKTLNNIKKGMAWSIEEDNILLSNYPTKGGQYCSQLLNRSISGVVHRANRLGIIISHQLKSQYVVDWFKNNPKKDYEYKVNSEQFINFASPEAVYILGFLWGDGHIKIAGKYQRYVMIEICNDDYLDLKHIFDKTGNWPYRFIARRKPHYCDVASLCLSQPLLVDFLKENDYNIKRKTNPFKILSKIPDHLKHYFILGWFDSDGNIYYGNKNSIKSLSICAYYDHDWILLEKIFDRLQIKYKISRVISSKGKSSSIHSHDIKSILNFYKYVYSSFIEDGIGLNRKRNIFHNIFNHSKHTIININEIF